MPIWGVRGPTKPICGHFLDFSLGIYLVFCIPIVTLGHLGFVVNPSGRQRNGKRSHGQGFHGHGEVSRPIWGVPGRTTPISGHFLGFWRGIHLRTGGREALRVMLGSL